MFVRRIASVAAAIAFTFAVAATSAAQDNIDLDEEPYALTLELVTCQITGGLPSVTIAPEANPSGIGTDCVEGWPDDADITLAAQAPDEVSGSSASWTGLSHATYRVEANVALVENSDVYMTGDKMLVATYYVSNLPPAEEEDYLSAEEADDTGTTSEGDTSSGQSASTNSEVADLPQTGTGPVDNTGTAFALAASGLIASGVVAIAGSRAIRQQ